MVTKCLTPATHPLFWVMSGSRSRQNGTRKEEGRDQKDAPGPDKLAGKLKLVLRLTRSRCCPVTFVYALPIYLIAFDTANHINSARSPDRGGSLLHIHRLSSHLHIIHIISLSYPSACRARNSPSSSVADLQLHPRSTPPNPLRPTPSPTWPTISRRPPPSR